MAVRPRLRGALGNHVLDVDSGATVFGASGVCQPDQAKVLFYWNCDAASPFALLASVANFALTVTVWAPVYVAAATVNVDAMMLALPIVLFHVVGLPAAIYVLIRLMVKFFDLASGRVHPAELAGADAAPGTSAMGMGPGERPPRSTAPTKPRG